ncbi:MAG: phosphatidylserine/phosphatidylglycerophosphate/cardiolipin synthase family protein [Desulfitobacteriaceae bacterium]|nr:phosphatidylserine/phosphatidylglycerophosphate/cardiolipin synthase family protein [Desulfitobacteriaceae bacterium]MDD4347154.1 phosphatidylserine/phosphatidylglycerophosphate/cardiolipin synthase family protein [Desulfitobacteriaceae bacterium]
MNGDAIYNLTVDMISSAKKSVYVEQAEFDDSHLIQLLIQKAREGLEIRILLDQWQQVNQNTLDQLKSQNISVQFYPARKGQYNRVKLLVVDHEQALVYGSPWTEKGFDSDTLAVKLTDRSAWKAANVFSRDWEFTTTLTLNVPKTSSLPDDNIILATNAKVKQQVIENINSSTKTIWVKTALVSEEDTVQALINAVKKGREVQLILDPTEVEANPVTIETLRNGGIQIRTCSTNKLRGLNVGIFDEKTFIQSSSSWTHNTFVINHELSITVPSPTATKKLVELFNQDWIESN